MHGDVAVLDLREEEIIHAGNRFMVYALFPQARRLGARAVGQGEAEHRASPIGKSIVDRSSPVDVGAVCLAYGGGGHPAAGTCQVPHTDSVRVLGELVGKLRAER